MQEVCSPPCAVTLGKQRAEKAKQKELKKQKSDWNKEKAQRKEALMTASDWRNLLQQAFNGFIRERDRDKPCISCGTTLKGKYDAGHFYSVGSYPNLRFHEDNCHGQCVQCNRDKHGNHTEYSLRLPDRIGQMNFDNLVSIRHGEDLKLSIPEIKEKIQYYRERKRELERQRTAA
jgi:hypothetical protein